ncbi:MAG: WD40 repeat domain-containing protein [Cyanobacteria bacterium P01_A01_bin.114]
MAGLALFSGLKTREAEIQQIETSIAWSDANLANNRRLEADIESIRAARILQNPFWQTVMPNPQIKLSVLGQLQQTFNDGQEQNRLEGHQGYVRSVVYSPDGTQLATSGDDGTARVWDTEGNQLAVLEGHQGHVWSVVYSPDGTQLATSGSDGTARVWDTEGNQPAVLDSHKGPVRSIVYSPDGTQLATSGSDGTARVWDTEGHQLAVLEGHQGRVRSVVYSPDGTQLATSGSDGTARVWLVGGFDNLLAKQCDQVRDFLKNSPSVQESDRDLCDGIETVANASQISKSSLASSLVAPSKVASLFTKSSFNQALNQATEAAKLTQTAATEDQWNKVISHWQKAIDLMKAIPKSSPDYATAQQKIGEYEKNLQYAQGLAKVSL